MLATGSLTAELWDEEPGREGLGKVSGVLGLVILRNYTQAGWGDGLAGKKKNM